MLRLWGCGNSRKILHKCRRKTECLNSPEWPIYFGTTTVKKHLEISLLLLQNFWTLQENQHSVENVSAFCYRQAYDTLLYFETHMFIKVQSSTMLCSITSKVIVIILYLTSKTLRTPFFGQCILSHMLSYITYKSFYLHNILTLNYSSYN